MAKEIKTIGVLTSGGDAPGMNAAIRAVVRTAIARGLKVKGIKKGYQGLLNEEIIDMEAKDVSDIIQRGGTILGTARCLEFKEAEGQKKGAEICRKHGIDGIVVIVGLPGTIDLDIACTEYTIGFDTAVNTAMQAIDKVKDTSSSHERCSIIEVMGRNAGYIALWCGIANGAEDILLPEKYDYNEQNIINNIITNRKHGKILGYMQRGGSPTAKDRYYASIMGAYAVDIMLEGKTNRVVGYQHGEFIDFDIEEALQMQKGINEYQFEVSHLLSI